MATSTKTASDEILASWKAAEKAAIAATNAYVQAAKFAAWKPIAAVTGIGIVVILIIAFAFSRYATPSIAEIQSLAADCQNLEFNIKQLEALGGRKQINNCDGRVCVKIDLTAQKYTDNYFVIAPATLERK